MDKERVNYDNQFTFNQKENGVVNLIQNYEIKNEYKNKNKNDEKYKNLKNKKKELKENNFKSEKMSEKLDETFNEINSIVVHLLNGGKFECTITSKATGLDVFKKTCDYLILREHEYFGLTYLDGESVRNWVNLEKKILKQIKDNLNSLHFEVKFFPQPTILKENITRYFLTLQIRNNILNEKISCSSETYALLGSYLVQSELGNYDSDKHGKDYLKDFKFAPNPTSSLIARLAELHKQRKGQTSSEADLAFLQNAKKLSIYGLDFYPAKDSNNSEITIGVCSSGLSVYKNKIIVDKFSWPKIMKISYVSNNFYIKVKPCESEEYENTIGFELSSSKAAKGLWKITVDHHTFFKSLNGNSSSKILNKISSKGDLKSNKTSKHYIKHQKDGKPTDSSFLKHHRDHSKIKKDTYKNSEKLKQCISRRSKSKENGNTHHQINKNHHSDAHRKRKREDDKSHHHKEFRHYHELDTVNKDHNKKSESKKYSSSKSDKNKKYKHKHDCDSDKKLVDNQKNLNKEHKSYDQDKHKYKSENTQHSHHKHHKNKKSKKSNETRLSPSLNENKFTNEFEEILPTNIVKKTSSHFIRDIINLDNEYNNNKNLTNIKEIDRLEIISNEISNNIDNYEDIINKEIPNNSTCTITNKPGSPPKKDVKLLSKSNVQFDIFWDNEKSQEKFTTDLTSITNKNLNDDSLEDKSKTVNIDSETRFIPRVLLNGNTSINNQQQNKKLLTVGPKTPPDDSNCDNFCTNTLSNQSIDFLNETQQNKTIKINDSPIESLNTNSIKSLSQTSQTNSDSESNSNKQQNNKKRLIDNFSSNDTNSNKQEVYDPEAPLESPDNNQLINKNDFVQNCSSSQINNQFQNSNPHQNNSGDEAIDMEIDSPYSPPQQSSPIESSNSITNFTMNSFNSHFTAPALKSVLDHLIKAAQLQQKNQILNKTQQSSIFTFKKPSSVTNLSPKNKVLSLNKKITLGSETLDEIPSSAVELKIREKYIKKLNRQERVVEELKCSLKPFYQKREINKDEYKEIMRKAVPKICHSKTGEINPVKIKQLVENYINKLKHHRKSHKT